MPEWLVWLLILIVLPPVAICAVVYLSVIKMSSPELCLKPAERERYPNQYRTVAQHEEWAEQQGFDWVGGFMFQGTVQIFVAVWQHAGHPSYFCLYLHGQNVMNDFVTIFDEAKAIGLTTASTKDGLLLPATPGGYVQAFPGRSKDELWDLHLAAEQFLIREYRIEPKLLETPFEQVLTTAVRGQMEYVRTIPLWPLRGPYWYFVRRNLMQNKSIEQQHAAGKIQAM